MKEGGSVSWKGEILSDCSLMTQLISFSSDATFCDLIINNIRFVLVDPKVDAIIQCHFDPESQFPDPYVYNEKVPHEITHPSGRAGIPSGPIFNPGGKSPMISVGGDPKLCI